MAYLRMCICVAAVLASTLAVAQSLVGTWKGGYTYEPAKFGELERLADDLLKTKSKNVQITLVLKKDQTYVRTKVNKRVGKPVKETGIWAQFGSIITLERKDGRVEKMVLGKNRKTLSEKDGLPGSMIVLKKQ